MIYSIYTYFLSNFQRFSTAPGSPPFAVEATTPGRRNTWRPAWQRWPRCWPQPRMGIWEIRRYPLVMSPIKNGDFP